MNLPLQAKPPIWLNDKKKKKAPVLQLRYWGETPELPPDPRKAISPCHQCPGQVRGSGLLGLVLWLILYLYCGLSWFPGKCSCGHVAYGNHCHFPRQSHSSWPMEPRLTPSRTNFCTPDTISHMWRSFAYCSRLTSFKWVFVVSSPRPQWEGLSDPSPDGHCLPHGYRLPSLVPASSPCEQTCLPGTSVLGGFNKGKLFSTWHHAPTQRKCSLNVYWILK